MLFMRNIYDSIDFNFCDQNNSYLMYKFSLSIFSNFTALSIVTGIVGK